MQPISKLFKPIILVFALSSNTCYALNAMQEDKEHVKGWNNFTQSLLKIHQHYLKKYSIRTVKSSGGYPRLKNFYTEIHYYDKATNRILSKIQWEQKNPKNIHLIEVFIYDEQGRVIRDYLSSYLATHRNAPIQTLINLHSYDTHLHGFRQFDASGFRIYEQCKGKYFGEDINISLSEDEISPISGIKPKVISSDAYRACFSQISISAAPYLNPLDELIESKLTSLNKVKQAKNIKKATKLNKQNPMLLVQSGNLHFELHEFKQAVSKFTEALKLNSKLADAYFGRGMALGRMGKIAEGIKDLSKFIKLRPKSSFGYTKRGVRYIWLKKLSLAEKDFLMAIKLDKTNSEAHDDLGVLLAQKKQWGKASLHFKLAIKHDSSYQKAHHNLAMVLFISNQLKAALVSVNNSLSLNNKAKNSLLLKSEILRKLGNPQQANAILENAKTLPDTNWSEQMPLQ